MSVGLLLGLDDVVKPLTGLLIISAVLSNAAAAKWGDTMSVSGTFMASMLAVAFLDAGAAVAVVVVAEFATWLVERYRLRVLPINLFSSAMPTLVAAVLFALVGAHRGAGFYAALAVLACIALALNLSVLTALMGLLDASSMRFSWRLSRELVPTLAINVALTLAVAAMYLEIGLAGLVFVVVAIVAFAYMSRLVVLAQERTQQYASLSWGVLAGLLRSLDQRDPRAARHAAAVAAFARDIAAEAGLDERECELAHTAGLLHDIGGFGLSDRVMERGRTLTEQDWESIRRHPVLGADLLRDLGTYGPVAQIVRAHHERVDGRGYPDRLSAEEIPELAKIVAVAEVYDTLTAADTYRTQMSSFEALNELRRVSGTQLEGRYVEALAKLLSGRSVDYRHAYEADFDRELDLERRIMESVEDVAPVPLTGTDGAAAGAQDLPPESASRP